MTKQKEVHIRWWNKWKLTPNKPGSFVWKTYVCKYFHSHRDLKRNQLKRRMHIGLMINGKDTHTHAAGSVIFNRPFWSISSENLRPAPSNSVLVTGDWSFWGIERNHCCAHVCTSFSKACFTNAYSQMSLPTRPLSSAHDLVHMRILGVSLSGESRWRHKITTTECHLAAQQVISTSLSEAAGNFCKAPCLYSRITRMCFF